MAARRNIPYSVLPTEDRDEDNIDRRFTYTPKSLRRIPWKSIALALFLLFLGSSLLFLSYFIFTGHMEGDSTQVYGLLFLGILAFLPVFIQKLPPSDLDRVTCGAFVGGVPGDHSPEQLSGRDPGSQERQAGAAAGAAPRPRKAATALRPPRLPAVPEQASSLHRLPKHRVAVTGRRSFAARAGSYPGNVGVPKQWYNLIADLPVKPPPMLHPGTHQPLNPSDLAPLFPDELIRQELTEERFIDIPDEVRDVYELWRPTPLIRYRKEPALFALDAGFRGTWSEVFAVVIWQGQEAGEAARHAGEDLLQTAVLGGTGGGSNVGALAFPFMREKLAGRMNPQFKAVEPAACPTLTKGVYAYDYGDTAGLTPLMKMHTLGHDFVPDPIHAGGLRYHGMAPLISHVYELGFMEAMSIQQTECFEAALQFARTEGIIPAPEPTHAIAAAIREALECKRTGEEKVILIAMCGHGHFDLAAYDRYLRGDMIDLSHSAEKLKESLGAIPKV
uniref:tryptophan synthase n=1 Tax=Aegilops tauschii TaxID=37682 RepID=N1QXX5_AEGTA